jgi:hypothetical protein
MRESQRKHKALYITSSVPQGEPLNVTFASTEAEFPQAQCNPFQ